MTDRLAAEGWAYIDRDGDRLEVDSCGGSAIDLRINDGSYVELPAAQARDLAHAILRNLDARPAGFHCPACDMRHEPPLHWDAAL